MKSRVSSLMALLAASLAGTGTGTAAAPGQASAAVRSRSRSLDSAIPTRTSKAKSKGAARVRPVAPWLPNVKGTRFEKGVRVSR